MAQSECTNRPETTETTTGDQKPARGLIGRFVRRPALWLGLAGGVMIFLPILGLQLIHWRGLLTAQVFAGPEAVGPTVTLGGLPISVAGIGLIGCAAAGAVLLVAALSLDLIRRLGRKR